MAKDNSKAGNTPCEMCGKVAPCKPVGPNNESICFACASSSPEIEEQVRAKLAAQPTPTPN